MNSEEKFKELLKEKLGTKEFPLNLANWEKAQAMIDATRSKKRRNMLFLFLCFGIFIVTGLFLYFDDNARSNTQTVLADKAGAKETEATVIEQKSGGSRQLSNPVKSGKQQITEGQDRIEKPAIGQAKQQGEKMERSTGANAQQPENNAPENVASTNATVSHQNKIKETANNIETKAMMASVKMKRSNSKTPAPTHESSANKDSQTVTTPVDQQVQSRATVKIEPDIKNNENGRHEATTKEPDVFNKPPVPANLEPLLPPVASSTVVTDGPEKNTALLPENNADPATPLIKDITATPSAPVPSESVATITEEPKKEKRTHLNIFSLEAGLVYHSAWKNTVGKDANGINPLIGLNYSREIINQLSLSLGIHYTTVNNLSNYSHTSVESNYSFGETNKLTVITPVKIHYLLAPIKLSYALDQKNMIGAGYTFAYLLTVNDKVENYTQRLNSTSDHIITKTKGYSQGFNPFDSQLSLFYRRKLYNDLFANAEFFYGLADIKNNSFFSSNYFERNMGIKFTLIYNIFKK